MDEPAVREQMISDFDGVVEKLGESGASARTAQAIVEELNGSVSHG
jgi:hypothetical protein